MENINIKPFANITKYKASRETEDAVIVAAGGHFSRVYMLGQDRLPSAVFIEEDAAADIHIFAFPGVTADVALEIVLCGRNATLNLSGAYILGSDEKVRLAIDVFHEVPSCYSRQLFKGLVGGSAKADFYGKVIVAPDAQKTEAYQENHNLLLSDDAKVNARPQLEIYADDVKCSHGATVGRLNEEEQFYMRSRGITLEEARALQMISFVSPVIAGIQEPLHEDLSARLDSAIRRLL